MIRPNRDASGAAGSSRRPHDTSRRQAIEQRIAELGPWFHNMRLDGVMTAPDHFLHDYPQGKWDRIAHAIPQDLAGMTVLDIGCNAGFHSIQVKKRGAERVLGIDSDERYLAQARFAAEISEVDIELRQMDVYELPQLGEQFDLVLFMGVLYHLRYPLLALDLIHEHAAKNLLVFQSTQRGGSELGPVQQDYDFWEQDVFYRPWFPRMSFVEHRFTGDPTNWWLPNRACVEAMLRSSGFEITEHPEEETYVCRWHSLDDESSGCSRKSTEQAAVAAAERSGRSGHALE